MDAVLAPRRRIRNPVAAGLFYPEDKKETLDYIRSFGLEKGVGGQARAIIAPHGAWNYSGSLAADAFRSAMGRNGSINRVVILGPIHDKREDGIFLSNSHYFRTTLGKIPVDHEISEKIEFYSRFFETNDIPHLGEHSIETLLPFVKFGFPHAEIVPILMGQPSSQYINDLASALKTVISPVLDETLLVVSSSFSSDEDTATARRLAKACLSLFADKDGTALASAFLEGRINACGGALAAGLFASGLIDKTRSCSSEDNFASAVDAENNTVFYGSVSFE